MFSTERTFISQSPVPHCRTCQSSKMGKMHIYLGEVHTCRMPHDILHFLDEPVEERYQILLSILLVSTLMKTHKKLV